MQHSVLNAFNPVKLAESLKLRATEQQDAQEYVALLARCINSIIDNSPRFSKLFMAHLDNEFRKQQNPELQSLIPNQVKL